MSDMRVTCPGCGASSNDVGLAFLEGRPCKFCGFELSDEAASDLGWGVAFARAIYPSPDLPNAVELQAAYARGWDDAVRRAENRH
jgi:hypothetical protein